MIQPDETALIAGLVLFGILLTATIIYFSIKISKRDTDRIQAFIKHLGFTIPELGEIHRARFSDIEISYRYTQLGRGKKLEFSVWVEHANLGFLKVRGESGFDRAFKRISIVAEVQTQDPIFDSAFFIDTSEPNVAQAFLTRQSNREAIDKIMQSGFDNVAISKDKILAQVTNPQLDTDNTARIRDVVEGLYALSIDQPAVAAHLGRDVRVDWKIRTWTMYIVLGLLATIGTALVFFGSRIFQPLDAATVFKHSLGYASLPFVVSVFVLIAYLRGRSTSHVHLLISGLIAIIAWPLFSCGALMVANGFNDDSLDTHHQGRIEKNGRVRTRATRPIRSKFAAGVQGGNTKIPLSPGLFTNKQMSQATIWW